MTIWRPRDPAQATRLCVACGLCCSGALYAHAELTPGDEPLIAALGMGTIAGEDGKGNQFTAIALPCPNLSGTACSVYDRPRPKVCGAYFCRLAMKLDRGEFKLAGAQAKVAQAHDLLGQLAPFIRPGETLTDVRMRWQQGQEEWLSTPDSARFHFLMTALNMLLDRHFRGTDQTVLSFSSGD